MQRCASRTPASKIQLRRQSASTDVISCRSPREAGSGPMSRSSSPGKREPAKHGWPALLDIRLQATSDIAGYGFLKKWPTENPFPQIGPTSAWVEVRKSVHFRSSTLTAQPIIEVTLGEHPAFRIQAGNDRSQPQTNLPFAAAAVTGIAAKIAIRSKFFCDVNLGRQIVSQMQVIDRLPEYCAFRAHPPGDSDLIRPPVPI